MLLKNGILADIQDNLIRKRRGSDVLPFFIYEKAEESFWRPFRLKIFFQNEKRECKSGNIG